MKVSRVDGFHIRTLYSGRVLSEFLRSRSRRFSFVI